MWTMSPSSKTMTWSVCSMMAAGSLERKYCRLRASSASFRSSDTCRDVRIATWAVGAFGASQVSFFWGGRVEGFGTVFG